MNTLRKSGGILGIVGGATSIVAVVVAFLTNAAVWGQSSAQGTTGALAVVGLLLLGLFGSAGTLIMGILALSTKERWATGILLTVCALAATVGGTGCLIMLPFLGVLGGIFVLCGKSQL